ncbi:GIY-YIG nuclease family protein [Sebaldella sp. S0638]|uniref:GIY-YIG nuclease family protein n=1 Tax=Sebaldella sp. S0638 TaxID=2957809 RepID=UPI0020A036D5|nr:GIY-YIG nuclease family protein [Sebaldella sp. S0638]MCP1225521.1 GIY-YIG nuclease family protein [Sebaldella sp. S0638]
MHYVYIVKCSDKTYYTGYTNDLEKRLFAHNAGKGAKYTRNRIPVEIVYFEEYEDKSEAMKREYAIKRLTRVQKEKLIKSKKAFSGE